ncbi:MAG: peptidylprolyl isomerase [Clostridia bacterium]|nr:peptidylprolyl isomerase [Clostridia bacterium]
MIQIEMQNGGIINLELYPDKAPITVENFVSLVNEKFYDGLIFHRVIKDFMIQGGDPEGTGFGGSGKTIQGEVTANGVANDLSHVRGVISMARSKQMDSASSQFFIVQKDSTYLDGQYAAFDKVIEGMDVVDEIASVATDRNARPLEDVVIKSIRVIE